MAGRTIATLLVAGALAGCAGRSAPLKTIEEVLADHTTSLMALPGVVGTAIGVCDGAPCIRVFLADSSAASRVPARLEGYAVKAEVTGRIRPRGGLED